MIIKIPFITDSFNTYSIDCMSLHSGNDGCVVITIGERSVSVQIDELQKALVALS